MEKQVYTFSNEIDEVEICSLGAKIIVVSTEENNVTAEYENPSNKPEFCAVLCGKHLTLKEKASFMIFGNKRSENYRITVRLPQKVYRSLKINTASGGVDLSDTAVTAECFNLNTASGGVSVNAFFENLKIKTASGSVRISNPTEKSAYALKINTASGSVSVNGYRAEAFSINSASGITEYSGACGKGEIRVTSGKIGVDYAEWNNDLKISVVSGNVNVQFPENSGINVQFDGASGSVKTDIGGEQGQFMNLGKGTNGGFGGANKHDVKVSLVSGTVTLAQKAQKDLL